MEEKKELSIIGKYREELLTYTYGMVLPSKKLIDLDSETKLKILQITPVKVLKQWPHWAYVPIWYIERALNYISNFNRWVKVEREFYNRKENKNWKIIHDARVLGTFYIVIDWNKIERSCYGSRQMYDNPAISDFAVIEAARSIATKSFADTLWIASDKLSKEFDGIRQEKEEINIEWITAKFSK